MVANENTVTLTLNPTQFLASVEHLSSNLKEVAQDAEARGHDIRVEFLHIPILAQYIPLSIMPCVRLETTNEKK